MKRQAAGQHRPAVPPVQQPLGLQRLQVAADGDLRGLQLPGQLPQRDRAAGPHQVEDALPSLRREHIPTLAAPLPPRSRTAVRF